MGISGGPNILGDENLAFIYDIADQNSYLGEPTTNFIPSPYDYSLYAYASGPVNTITTNELGNTITAKRYTITQAINVARAAIFPTSLSTGVAYTFSVKWRYNGTTTATPTFAMDSSKGNPEVNGSNAFTSSTSSVVSIGQGWYLSTYTFVFSTSPTLGCILTFGISTGATSTYVNETFDVYEAQFEVKDHRTQPVIGTRSVSGSLLDLSPSKTTINVTSMSFNTNAQLSFNGTSSVMNPTAAWSYLSSSALECVFKTNTVSGFKTIFGYAHNEGYSAPTIGSIYLNGSSLGASVITTTQVYRGVTASTTIATNTFYHVVLNKNTTTGNLDIYVNGVLNGTQTFDTTTYAQWPTAGNYIGSNVLDIGKSSNTNVSQGWSTSALTGSIPLARLYSRTLSASEILQNYNAQKSRFNL